MPDVAVIRRRLTPPESTTSYRSTHNPHVYTPSVHRAVRSRKMSAMRVRKAKPRLSGVKEGRAAGASVGSWERLAVCPDPHFPRVGRGFATARTSDHAQPYRMSGLKSESPFSGTKRCWNSGERVREVNRETCETCEKGGPRQKWFRVFRVVSGSLHGLIRTEV